MNLKIHNQSTFCQEIEKIVREQNVTYFEAICDYMQENNIEPETISKLINLNIRQQVHAEATDLNLLNRGKKPAKLF